MGDSIRSLLRRTSSCNRPWQLSAALALGVLCGLLPKFSLLFCALAAMCCCLPIHLPLAACTCFTFSFLTGPLAQTAGQAGLWSLTHASLADMWATLDVLPWLPWMGLNNSVVHGSLLIGLGLALPVFFLTRPLAASLSPARASRLATASDPDFKHELIPAVARRNSITRRVPASAAGLATAASALAERPREPLPLSEAQRNEVAARSGRDAATSLPMVDENTCLELEKLLATCSTDQANEMSAPQVAQRAAQMAQYVDELLSACELEPPTSGADRPLELPAVDAPATAVDHAPSAAGAGSGAAAHSSASSPAKPSAACPEAASSSGSTLFIHQPQQPTVVQPYVQPTELTRDSAGLHSSTRTESAGARERGHVAQVAQVAERRAVNDAHQAETLRYLLEHLRAIKDKV